MPRPRNDSSTSIMATHATGPNRHVVTVPAATPSSSATKHPSGCNASRRRQSASTWFQPACCFSRMPKGMSATVMPRMRSNGSILDETESFTGVQKDYTDGAGTGKHSVLTGDRSHGHGHRCD